MPAFAISSAGVIAQIPADQDSSTTDLEIYIQGPEGANVEDSTALMLFTTAGQLYRQGVAKKGRLRWHDVAPMQYQLQVVAPGFARGVQDVDALGSGEVLVKVQLKVPLESLKNENDVYPAVSSDPEINYVFGRYASRLGNWDQAKLYWTKVLELLPDHVVTLVAMSEALRNQHKDAEADEYLERAEKLEPNNWRAQAALADSALAAGETRKAIQHAERAIELGREEAAGIYPLLARALRTRADEVLQAYLKEHPEDAEAQKQPARLGGTSYGADTGNVRPTIRKVETTNWLPPGVDESVPPVELGAACNLTQVLEKTGRKVQEFVGNVDRFTATESLLHETINRTGKVSSSEKRKYDYVVSIQQTSSDGFDVEEFRSNGSTAAAAPGGIITKGLPALVLIFHPYYSGTFSMKCEGLTTWNGKRTWQIYFRQRKDKPNKIRAYRVGLNIPPYPVALKGRAWIVEDSYQLLSLQTDLAESIPDIRLTAEHTAIEYGPVHFASRGLDMWLPQSAEVYSELRGKRIHRRLSFSNYLLFSVDDKQQIAAPKAGP